MHIDFHIHYHFGTIFVVFTDVALSFGSVVSSVTSAG